MAFEAEHSLIPPELPLLVDRPPIGDEWIHEIKFDGYRIQAHIVNRQVTLFTRSGHDWTEKYPTIAQALKKMPIKNAIFDGEIVAQDREGKSDFQALQLAMQNEKDLSLKYFIFDLLFLDGDDLRDHSLIERKRRLEKIVKKAKQKNVLYSSHAQGHGKDFLQLSCNQGLEGLVSKKIDSHYVSGRTKDWVKSKCTQRQEFVIGGFTEGTGSRATHFGALLLGVYEDHPDGKKLRYVGRCGTGFNTKILESVYRRLKELETLETPFDIKSPRERDVHFVKPALAAEIGFSMWTRDQILRTPVFYGLREDKPVKQIVHEKAKKLVELSNPQKVLYPKEKITKKQIAEYYEQVARWMLPHVHSRPLALKRCPDGTTSTCFFQKHMGRYADVSHLHEIEIRESKGVNEYVTVDSTPGLVSLVQMGAFELHIWGSRAPEIEYPDQIVMDFDPDPGVGFSAVKKAVLELKALLDHLKLKSFLKTTGGKGLHVHIPVEPVYTWDQIKSFSKTLADHMVATSPDRYTSMLSKKARHKKIFVDYLRNGRGATAVAPYSLRARETSSIAMPIDWKDLPRLKNPAAFTLAKGLAYLKRRKKDPWEKLLKTKQRISLLEH